MPAIYHLSNRQQGDLTHGLALQIAIPTPWYEVSDERIWVESVLDIDPEFIREISTKLIYVDPGFSGKGSPIMELIGGLYNDPDRATHPDRLICVNCYIVVLCRWKVLPGKVAPFQWPNGPLTYPGATPE